MTWTSKSTKGGSLDWYEIALEMQQMSCFWERFVVWNGYVCKSNNDPLGKHRIDWVPRKWELKPPSQSPCAVPEDKPSARANCEELWRLLSLSEINRGRGTKTEKQCNWYRRSHWRHWGLCKTAEGIDLGGENGNFSSSSFLPLVSVGISRLLTVSIVLLFLRLSDVCNVLLFLLLAVLFIVLLSVLLTVFTALLFLLLTDFIVLLSLLLTVFIALLFLLLTALFTVFTSYCLYFSLRTACPMSWYGCWVAPTELPTADSLRTSSCIPHMSKPWESTVAKSWASSWRYSTNS